MSFDDERPGTAGTTSYNNNNNGLSPYHRNEAPFGHNHCPNCGEAYPPELLYPTKVGRIVQMVWRQNKQEKQAAKDLSRHSPRELLQNIQRQHEEQRQLQLQLTNGGINNNNNNADVAAQQQKESMDALLAHADDNLNALVPSTLFNIKSPDWTDLPPCIARFRLSLFQLRLNNKMMEKMTSLCENCFGTFFPGEDPSAQIVAQNGTTSPNARGLSPTAMFTSSTNNNNNNYSNNNNNNNKRSPLKPSITFEDYIAQSRFPDRAKDFAFSDVGRAMRHAAAEAKAKQDIRTSLFAHIDKAQEMITESTTAPLLMLNNNNIEDGSSGGGINWTGENNNNNNTNNLRSLFGASRHGSVIPTSPNNNTAHSRIRFLLGNQTSLASIIERQALDPLPISVIDVPFADWLQRELWDEVNKVVEFGKDIACTSSYTQDPEFPGEDVPPNHPFFELYSRNRLRLPTPSSRGLNAIASETNTATLDSIRVNRWKPKPGSSSSPKYQKRSVSSPTTTNSSQKKTSASSSNTTTTKSASHLASALLPTKVEQSYFRDQQMARDLSIPQNLSDSERKCLIEILAGQSLSDPSACSSDFALHDNNKKLLKINGMKKSHQLLWMIPNNNQNQNNIISGSSGSVVSSAFDGHLQQPQHMNSSSSVNVFGGMVGNNNNINSSSTPTINGSSKTGSAWDVTGSSAGGGGTYRFGENTKNHNNNPNHNMNHHDLPSAIEDFLDSS